MRRMIYLNKFVNFQIGYDLLALHKYGIKVALYAPLGHTICVGGTGSGKSTALLYWLYKMTRSKFPLDLYIADFKACNTVFTRPLVLSLTSIPSIFIFVTSFHNTDI